MILIFLMLFVSPFASTFPKEAVDFNLTYSADSIKLNQDSLYTVKKGETLYGIAKSKETTVALLKAWNNLTNSEIQAGQKILVVDPNSEKTNLVEEISNLPKVSSKDSIHVVVKGEYISGIAKKYNLDVKNIAVWNKLKSPDRIYPGQELKLYPVEIIPIDNLLVLKEIPIVINEADSIKDETVAVNIDGNNDTTAIPATNDGSTKQDTAVNSNLSYDFNPGGVKTLINVLILVLLLAVFIYNIHK